MAESLRVNLTPALRQPAAASVPFQPLLQSAGPRVVIGTAQAGDQLAIPVSPTPQTLFGPRGGCLFSSRAMWIADTGHHRLLGWRQWLEADNTPADWIIGQPDFFHEGRNAKGETTASTLNVPTGVAACGKALAVADAWNHRILIWHEAPDASHRPADVVLGQESFSSAESNRGLSEPTAATLFWPYGVHWDGARLWVADTGNRRVLMWNGLPVKNGQPADLVLGQPSFISRNENGGGEPNASSMRWPHAIGLWNGMLCVTDAGNNRVMIWNGVPQSNNLPCAFVLGQRDFAQVDHNQSLYWPNAASLNMPYGLAVAGSWLMLADTANSRLLGWHADDGEIGAAAKRLTGQPDFHSKGDNRWQAPARDSLCWPYGIAASGDTVLICDSGNNRVLLWDLECDGSGVALEIGSGKANGGSLEGIYSIHHSSVERTTKATPSRRAAKAERITVQGLVQGVGFRPTVWRLAHNHKVRGWVMNNGDGVEIHACGNASDIEKFVVDLTVKAPPLARVDKVSRNVIEPLSTYRSFSIADSAPSSIRTGVVPDAGICEACQSEILDPFARRYRYPFTNCTHCGPRLSIIQGIPYDRQQTTMAGFVMCEDCQREYLNPADRRFHAQPIACYVCGPRAWLERADGKPLAVDALTMLDDVDAACTLLQRGHIVAVKGIGGFQLACDATNEEAVARLRQLKARERKPFALMLRDLEVAREYCRISETEAGLMKTAAAPIVILPAHGNTGGAKKVAASVAPGVGTLGMMLPNSPLHHLLLRRMNRPIVLTSGNLTDEPQCIDNDEARQRLGQIAEYFLMHNRPIAQRVDDSVVKVMAGRPRMLRRARGYAPAPLLLPEGFAAAPPVLAFGGELKNTFCLLRDGQAILSQHIGDLADALTQADYRHNLSLYETLYEHEPKILACDLHPEYLSSKLARERSETEGLPLVETQHHHAHIAACLAENEVPLNAPPVIGVALDGLGFGDDGTIWGGEFLLADYHGYKRLATFKPVAMPGGERAIHEPWRSTYAHLMAEMGWARFAMNFGELELFKFLEARPRAMLDGMLKRGVNSPLASSCGRLFDAVAAAIGICRERAAYEGQGAVELEAIVDETTLHNEDELLAYPFSIPRLRGSNLPYIEPLAMWNALLGDLILQTPLPVIAARFHKGLAKILVQMIDKLSRYESGDEPVRTVALSGGVFQNRILLEQVTMRLEQTGFKVLTHRLVPANDGGIALGQAAIAAARTIIP